MVDRMYSPCRHRLEELVLGKRRTKLADGPFAIEDDDPIAHVGHLIEIGRRIENDSA